MNTSRQTVPRRGKTILAEGGGQKQGEKWADSRSCLEPESVDMSCGQMRSEGQQERGREGIKDDSQVSAFS